MMSTKIYSSYSKTSNQNRSKKYMIPKTFGGSGVTQGIFIHTAPERAWSNPKDIKTFPKTFRRFRKFKVPWVHFFLKLEISSKNRVCAAKQNTLFRVLCLKQAVQLLDQGVFLDRISLYKNECGVCWWAIYMSERKTKSLFHDASFDKLVNFVCKKKSIRIMKEGSLSYTG